MFVKKSQGPRVVALPDGRILTVADLPAPTARWVASRKEVVVLAVQHGLIGRDEAMRRYGLSEEELDSWIATASRHGRRGLKATAVQKYRQPTPKA